MLGEFSISFLRAHFCRGDCYQLADQLISISRENKLTAGEQPE
jgi:hypothetical protein